MTGKNRILVIEDQPRERDAMTRFLRTEGYQTVSARNAAEALDRLAESIQLVICDVRLGTDSGVEILRQWKQRRAETPFVMVTAFGEVQSAVSAMKLGAVEYLTKPVNPDELLLLIRRTLESRDLLSPSFVGGNLEPKSLGRILGRSAVMLDVLERVKRAAQVNSLALILGDSGTGKELIATALHELGPRKNGPYIAVNVAALPETLVESELFGSVVGAFTGAVHDRIGRFEAAHGGTLFIDEIGDFPLAAQAKLLRVLENLTVNPVGSNEERRIDVRVVAATSRNLPDLISKGQFRTDLFYRLNVLTIQLPPLRERREDLPELIDAFIADALHSLKRAPIAMAPDLRDFLLNYHWPGNVRELRNLTEHMVVMCRGESLTLQDLPDYVSNNQPMLPEIEAPQTPESLHDLERSAVLTTLERHRGNRTRAAEALGISVRTLQRKLKAWGLAAWGD